MNELDDFIGKWRKLRQAGKEAILVLNTLAGNAWATISVHLGHGGPVQHIQQQKAWGARNGPAQQRRREKQASARATQGRAQNATGQAAAATTTMDGTEKDGPNERVEK